MGSAHSPNPDPPPVFPRGDGHRARQRHPSWPRTGVPVRPHRSPRGVRVSGPCVSRSHTPGAGTGPPRISDPAAAGIDCDSGTSSGPDVRHIGMATVVQTGGSGCPMGLENEEAAPCRGHRSRTRRCTRKCAGTVRRHRRRRGSRTRPPNAAAPIRPRGRQVIGVRGLDRRRTERKGGRGRPVRVFIRTHGRIDRRAAQPLNAPRRGGVTSTNLPQPVDCCIR